MFERIKAKYLLYGLFMLVTLVVLLVATYNLVAIGGSTYAAADGNVDVVTVTTPGARGSIYDSKGVLLAYDVLSYDVQFYRDQANNASSDRAHYTQVLMQAIEIIEKNEDELNPSFMIKKDEGGVFVFNFSSDIDEATREKRLESWCKNMQVSDVNLSPEDMYYELRNKYRIPDEVDYELAYKILSIWEDVQEVAYKPYMSVMIAKDVSFQTISELETKSNELLGISVVIGYTREYPKGASAAHVVGYLGKMVDKDEMEQMQALGYTESDLVGKSGLEATMEGYLSGATSSKRGSKLVAMNARGSILSEAVTTEPMQGDSVVLTIDMRLQEVAEQALEENVRQIQKEQLAMYKADKRAYDELLDARGKKTISYAEAGAAIVMEVDTGNILTLASYPSYDLNLFTGGISEEDYKTLLETPGSPLFNNAISSTSTPGSIFKMATAIAGLMEGKITIHSKITDSGPYDKYITSDGGVAPECWITPNFSRHGTQNVVMALKNSCNYFFYEVADRLGITLLTKWADNLGLLSKTNVELTNEAVGWIGGQAVLYDGDKSIENQKTYKPILVYEKLKSDLKGFGDARGVEYSDNKLSQAALKLVKLAGLGSFDIGPEIREILSSELDIPENVARARGWTTVIMDTVRELMWTDTYTATQGIGATPTQLTPIAVIRYLCAIVNGGKVYDAHIVDKIVDSSGNLVEDVVPTLVRDLNLPKEYTDAIMEGMEQVVSLEDGGTAGSAFKDFEYKDILAGKTGTAPISNIDIEDNVWLCLVAPKKDPEIAVVVFLPNGYSNAKAFSTAKAIIKHYFDQKEKEGTGDTGEDQLVDEAA